MDIRIRRHSWLERALCTHYTFARMLFFSVPMRQGVLSERWCWGFALFATSECEVLGAWSDSIVLTKGVLSDLANRGIEHIGLMSIQAPIDGSLSTIDGHVVSAEWRQPTLRIGKIFSADVIDEEFRGHRRRALRLAVATSDRLHVGLVNAVHRRSPFASSDAASEFISGWLQRAERRLYEARRPTMPILAHAA